MHTQQLFGKSRGCGILISVLIDGSFIFHNEATNFGNDGWVMVILQNTLVLGKIRNQTQYVSGLK